jgi:ElaB/YqjD/DUF883 family membrane-anchored ribosome-binding protein
MTTHIQDIVKPETWNDAPEKLSQANEQLEQVDQRVRQLVRDYPIGMLLGAAFVGHLIGRLVSRR